VQLYGTLTGMFWCSFSLLILSCCSSRHHHAALHEINRPTEAFLESLNPKYRKVIQLEALAVILLHAG